MVENILLSEHMANVLNDQRIHENTLIVRLYLFELSDNPVICMSNHSETLSTSDSSDGCIQFINSLNSM